MPHKLTSGEIHFLRLIAKGQQCPAGWAPVSKVLYPLVKEMPTELVEHCSVEQTGGRNRAPQARRREHPSRPGAVVKNRHGGVRMSLTQRTSVKCVYCGAAPGKPCIGSVGQERRSVHVERWQRKLAADRKRKLRNVSQPTT